MLFRSKNLSEAFAFKRITSQAVSPKANPFSSQKATAFSRLNRNEEADQALEQMWCECEAHNKKWANYFRKNTILRFSQVPGKVGYALVDGAYKFANRIVRFN